MTEPRRSRLTRWIVVAFLLVAPSLSPLAAEARTKSASSRSSASNDSYEAAKQILDAQEDFRRAQQRFYAKDYDEAVDILDDCIRALNQAVTSSRDARLRKTAGHLLARAGSLRLASVNRRDGVGSTDSPKRPDADDAKTVKQDKKKENAERSTRNEKKDDSAVTAERKDDDSKAAKQDPNDDKKEASKVEGNPSETAKEAKESKASEATEPTREPVEKASVENASVEKASVEPASSEERPSASAQNEPLDDATLDAPAVDDPRAIQVESNARVDRWLDYFTGRGRPTFERWLNRSGLYMGWMKKILEREGVPTDLVHLVFVESGFNPHARSYSAAVGPWQFIRGTAKLFGLKVNSWVDERKDPEASTVAAARYLKHLYSLFNSWPLALASYNSGERTVMNAVSRQGTKDFWALSLPRETREYVPQFMAVLTIARDPKRYGFDGVTLENPMTYDEVTLPAPVDMRAIASACNTSIDEMKRLNPSVLGIAAPGHAGTVSLRVPEGSGERLMASIQDGSLVLPKVKATRERVVLRHKVRRGESLRSLSARYGVPATTIARYNRIGRRSRLRVGRTLLIPQTVERFTPAEVASAVASAASLSSDEANLADASSSDEPDALAPRKTTRVRVKRGDTLSGIAARYGLTLGKLKRMNGLKSSKALRGQLLVVSRGSGSSVRSGKATRSTRMASLRTIRVKRGQTLSEIAAFHGTTVSRLRSLNGMAERQPIRVGQRLRVPKEG